MTATEEQASAELGLARLRKEDARLITGQTNWTDNITLPGLLHIAYLRSPHAHARIVSVDTSGATGQPGVVAAFSGADFADEQGSLPCAWPVTPDIVIPAHPPMATDEVRYVGEAVACVVARDRTRASSTAKSSGVRGGLALSRMANSGRSANGQLNSSFGKPATALPGRMRWIRSLTAVSRASNPCSR